MNGNKTELATFNSSPCQYHRGHALSIHNISLSHDGGRVLFDPADVVLKHGSITGLVGTNGAGKTSLARVLASKALPGFPRTLVIEYLAASDDEECLAGSHDEDYESSLALKPIEYIQLRIRDRSDRLRAEIDELESQLEDGAEDDLEDISNQLADIYELEEALAEKVQREMDHALHDLGLTNYTHKRLSELSSGWRYKCRLVAAFLTHPDLLIIDEPSFLDADSTDWFVTQTQETAKTDNSIVLLISHKEALLDTLCDQILYINSGNQTLTSYHCSYSIFRSTHEAQVQHAIKSVDGTEKKLQTAEKSLKHLKLQLRGHERKLKAATAQNADQRFIKGKNKEAKQKADRSAASKLKQAKRQVDDVQEMKRQAQKERVKPLHLDGMLAEGTVVSLYDLGVAYDGETCVFENVDACLEANDRVLLVGPNGCGKSTLIKVILGEMMPTRGSVTRKGNFIYFPQTALSQLLRNHGWQAARDLLGDGLTETQARQLLGNFGLARDLALRPIATLSAGQRVRLWLAKEHLLHPKPSLLVVDEISENVDVETRDSLADLLSNFEGAVLVVSHDPDFRNSFQPKKTWKLGSHGVHESYAE